MKTVKCYSVVVFAAAMLFGASIAVVEAKCLDARTPDPADFTSPQDNLYFPQDVGTTYLYRAETEDELIENQITITFDTVEILGFTCTVVHDVEQVSPDGGVTWFPTEETDDWYAWDNEGNVWYFGEATVEYLFDDNWEPIGSSTAGSWQAGEDGALPGIIMLAAPQPGLCYRQEYYEGEAEDMGKVLRLNASVSVPWDDYEDCLETKEWTPLAPGVVEHKYYAPGVGLVFVEELNGKTIIVELVAVF